MSIRDSKIPKLRQGFSFPLIFCKCTKDANNLICILALPISLSHFCASETAHQRDEQGPVWTRGGSGLLAQGYLGVRGHGQTKSGSTFVLLCSEKQMLNLLVADAQSSLFRTQSLICYSEFQTPSLRAPCRVQTGWWGSMLSSCSPLLLSQYLWPS